MDEGGLGLRSLISINEAANLKLCWEFLNTDEDWAHVLRSRVLRGQKAINHHIFSSLWSSIKSEMSVIKENSCWKVGTGHNINLWNDPWCGVPLAQSLHIHQSVINGLLQQVSDIILNQQWHIPPSLNHMFPNLKNLVHHITLPVDCSSDQLCWNHSSSGTISWKLAYEFKRKKLITRHWARSIWSNDIPPSKSLLVWRLMHDKLPTDEKLMERGFNLPSMCSICHKFAESTFHLFFECTFAQSIWCWFASVLNTSLQFQSIEEIWHLWDNSWSPQCKLSIKAALIYLLNAIWSTRNNARFNSKVPVWKSAVAWILSNTSLTGNITKCVSSSSIKDFMILKSLNITIHPPLPPLVKEVVWHPPLEHWVKCNIDGAANNLTSSCAGIFRNHNADFLCGFAENTGLKSAFMAELCGAMKAIELAHNRNWSNLWLKSDSSLVVKALSSTSLVSWELSNR
ncbi:uncharacterized protein LOC123888954 [Trifolium pratense]|uniref:uncharacterized protein LOC123888954 n=1 Tax=Trifolium pratense TaxID=57577 RepID=UPI001E690F10|nr:uncharacterized protein LOC123888954 [Trifolium pratense]